MFGHRYFAARYFGPRYFGDGGNVVAPVVAVQVGDGDGRPRWHPSEDELHRIRRHYEELEEATQATKKRRRQLERRLNETIRAAYRKAVGLDPEAAEAIVAALPPAAVVEAPKPKVQARARTAPTAAPLPTIDWASIESNLVAAQAVIVAIERHAAMVAERAARTEALNALALKVQGEMERIRQDEEDIELLLLAA